jgi:hypothetical protein
VERASYCLEFSLVFGVVDFLQDVPSIREIDVQLQNQEFGPVFC